MLIVPGSADIKGVPHFGGQPELSSQFGHFIAHRKHIHSHPHILAVVYMTVGVQIIFAYRHFLHQSEGQAAFYLPGTILHIIGRLRLIGLDLLGINVSRLAGLVVKVKPAGIRIGEYLIFLGAHTEITASPDPLEFITICQALTSQARFFSSSFKAPWPISSL